MSLVKVITYKTLPAKPEWLMWRNEYWFDRPEPFSSAIVALIAGKVLQFEQTLHLDAVSIHGALVYDVAGVQGGALQKSSEYFLWDNGNAKGGRQTRGVPLYRYGLMNGFECWPQRDSKRVYHGCLNADDLFIDKDGNLTLLTALEFQGKVWGTFDNNFDDFWKYVRCTKGGDSIGTPGNMYAPLQMYGSFPSDLHAATRARRVAVPRGVDAFAQLFGLVLVLNEATKAAAGEVEVQDRFIFAAFYDQMVAALSGMLSIGKQVIKYLEAAYQQDGQDMPARSRFGFTGASIAGALRSGGQWVDEVLPGLLESYQPFTYIDGYRYIAPDDLRPYVDAGKEWVSKLSWCLDFDWYNPNAYPRLGEDAAPPRVPDAIGLNL